MNLASIEKRQEQLLNQLIPELKDPSKRVVALVGSGLSRATPADIPTWIPMFKELCERCAELGHREVAAQQLQIAELAQYDPEYLTVCFEKLWEVMTPTAYESAIKTILSPKKRGTPAATKRMVTIPFAGIITTNLDDLIKDAAEAAFKQGQRPTPLEIYTSGDGAVQGNLARQSSWLWKIHGTIARPETWVFTATEYAESIYKKEVYREALKAVIQGSRLVFLGFGGADPDVNRILRFLSSMFGGRRDVHFLLARRREDHDVEHLTRLNVHIIEYGGPEDHSALIKLLDRLPRFSPKKRHKKRSIVTGDFDDSKYREWIIDQTDYIDIRGIGVGSGPGIAAIRFPILKIYTQLYVQRGLTNWDLDQGNIRGNQRIRLTDILKTARCVAIMGDPGAGKTTFLRYAARSQLLNPENPLPFYFSLLDVYQFASSKETRDSTYEHGRAEAVRFLPETFIEFLMDLSKKEGLELTRSGLQKRMQNGQCVWLLDSLDELPSIEAREGVVNAVMAASRRWKLCQFVITSRPLAMIGKAIPSGFEVVAIDHMQDEEIQVFLKTWTSLLFANSSITKQHEYFDELYSTIKGSPRLRTLAKNAVMLTSMAVVHYNEKHLPEGRADLLESVIHWLISAKQRFRQLGRDEADFIEARHRELALAMFEDKGGRKIRVGRQWAAGKIGKHFRDGEEAALEFLRREENETGLIVRRGEGDLAFWLPWFQEYLAAKEIAGKTDDENTGWWAKIRDHLDETEWREVLSLVPACLNRLGSDRVSLFFERLGNSCLNADLATKVKRVGLGGRILRDLLVAGYKPRDVPSWTRILNDILPFFKEEVKDIDLGDRYEAGVGNGVGG